MDTKIRTVPLRVKAAGPDDKLDEGQFEAYASVFGNLDSYGDIVDKGAFTRTLGEWQEKGETIPVLWGHDMQDPFANIGGVLTAEEDDHGLKISGQLDLENPTAAQVYRLIKGRRTSRMSFAYSVRDAEKSSDGYHLKDLDLFEVSIVQVPANELAEITAVKSVMSALAEGLKAGRTLSAKNEQSLREARDAIDSVLSSLGDDDTKAATGGEVQEQASGTAKAKPDASAEEPSGAKSPASAEEPKRSPSVDHLAALFNSYATAYAVEEGARS